MATKAPAEAGEEDDITTQKECEEEIVVTEIRHRDIATIGVVDSLNSYYRTIRPYGITSHHLCAPICHFCSPGMAKWDSGYRNVQMGLSSLLCVEPVTSCLKSYGVDGIPTVTQIQGLVEKAWELGFDRQGCSDLVKLRGTTKPIGVAQVIALYRMLRLELVEFTKPNGRNGTHPLLFDWAMTYFKTGWAPKCGGSSLGQSSAKGTGTAEVPVEQGQDKTTVAEDLPTKEEGAASNGPLFFPLYLQCEGKSRTVIGVEVRVLRSLTLLVLDPALPHEQMMGVVRAPSKCVRLLKKPLYHLRSPWYQMVYVERFLPEGSLTEQLKEITPSQSYP